MTGEVWLVGAGPGDPGLLTLKGKELLERAEVVVHDRLVNPTLLSHARRARLIEVGKRPGGGCPQEEINQLLIDLARLGKKVVRLKGGDPFIFGRGGEEALALAAAGIPFRVVPGVTAASGCAAYAGVPLTQRGMASSLGLATGHEDPGKDAQLDYRRLAGACDTLVVYMGVGSLERLVGELLAGGRSPAEPALVVERGTLAGQRVVAAPLADLPTEARARGVTPPALLIAGEVARLRAKLRWYEELPLAGCRVALTRPRSRWAPPQEWSSVDWELLGAEVKVYRLLRLEPPKEGSLREAVADLPRFRWVLFTSAPGVESFFAALTAEGKDARALAGCRVGAVGPGTAAALERRGIRADLVSSPATVEALAREVAARLEPGEGVLWPRSDLAASQAQVLHGAGAGEVREVVAYRALPEQEEMAHLEQDLRSGLLDVVALTSGSVAKLAAPVLLAAPRLPRVVAIGPVAARAAEEAGLPVAAVAEEHGRDGIRQAVVRVWRKDRCADEAREVD